MLSELFCTMVEDIQEVSQDPKDAGSTKIMMPWGMVATALHDCLMAYPTGITNALVVNEVQQRVKHTTHGRAESLGTIHREGKVAFDAVLDVVMEALYSRDQADTTLVSLKDFASEWNTSSASETVEMYLHRKFQVLDGTIFLPKRQSLFQEVSATVAPRFKFCGCKTVKSKQGVYQLLPTEFGVIILDVNNSSHLNFLKQQFTSHCLSELRPEQDYFFLAKRTLE
eukprot:m.242580 g.242580  ORF g.242580 m.242580 type:complete len:226 (-) comp16096_c0_seq14:5110-5787(-)